MYVYFCDVPSLVVMCPDHQGHAPVPTIENECLNVRHFLQRPDGSSYNNNPGLLMYFVIFYHEYTNLFGQRFKIMNMFSL